MKTQKEITIKLAELKPMLQQKYPVEAIALFGSYARNEQTEDSDVDVMIELNGKMGFKFVRMANEIENYLGIKTDVVSKNGIKPNYFVCIKNDLIYV
ncbi:nucleotidyltransferase family protein [Flavobacterium sp. SUN046]|uniref:nucleotidyltransferase family protein n=1 Tax=Flavobacterium sp. SUN046 TaxID=3002440 RepID=UPI002DBF39B3|nr:nucleotidyltransferase family protein [Flavobacterium sp. SUN046]MEC4048012.1 nucleotidyltransferase family protein [Flavobacterium sp. SUN046]